MRSLTLALQGLSCGNCVSSVKAALSKVSYLSSVSIALHNLPNRGSTLSAQLASDAPTDDIDVLAGIRAALPPKFTPALLSAEEQSKAPVTARSVQLVVHGLSCGNCVTSVKDALVELPYLASVDVALHNLPNRGSTLSAQLATDAPPDDDVFAAVRHALPAKFTVASSGSSDEDVDAIKPAPAPRVVRRFRCGCATTSCVCSSVPVISGDTGVLVRVSSDGTFGSSSADSCCCAAVGDVCCVRDDRPPQKHVAFSVSGMTCASCVSKIETFLRAQQGVASASVSLLTARATLQVDTAVFDADAVVSRLKSIGFEAVQLNQNAAQKDDVFLRFSDLVTAQKAVDTLRKSPLVADAEIYTSDGAAGHGNVHPALRAVGSCCGGHESKLKSGFSDGKENKLSGAEKPKHRVLRGKKAMPLVKLTSEKKLAAVKALDNGEEASGGLSYEVVSRNDPQLTGSLDATEVLRKEAHDLFLLFIGALVFTLPVVLCTMLFARVNALGAQTLTKFVGNSGFRVVDIIAFVLATPVQFVFGFRFYRGSWFSLKQCRANMDVLIALGTSIAYFFSVIILILNTVQIRNGVDVTEDSLSFEVSSLLITIVLFGKWMQVVAKKKTAAGVEALAKLAPRGVTLVSKPPAVEQLFDDPVHVELVSIGDHFQVNPGAAFPLDGAIEFGETMVDESMLTGESWPVPKTPGDAVYAGTVNGAKAVIVRCTATDSDSMLEKIVTLVKRAQESRAPIEAFADRVSAVFVPAVLVIALVVIVLWFVLAQTESIPDSWTEGEGNVLFSLLFGLSVLVIACPCALGLATPTVIMVATSIGARRLGILYKDGGEALQAAHAVKAVLFDKTGTLTIGNPVVTCAAVFGPAREEASAENGSGSVIPGELLRTIAAAESYSDHPLAQAIVAYSGAHASGSKDPIEISDHEAIPGKGIRCLLENGGDIRIGESGWVLSDSDDDMTLSTRAKSILEDWEACGRTVVLACVPDEPLVGFGIEDPVRYESVGVVSHLKKKGIVCGMVTGDSLGTARAVARIIDIDEDLIFARALPADKVKVVQDFAGNVSEDTDLEANEQAKGVVFVGDGINDAGALSAASVGIAMGSGSQIAAESAGIVLVRSNLWDVVVALDLAHKAFGRIKLNYVWALGFNGLAIPLAGGALYPLLEKRIPPYAAAAAMGLSSISVVLSSLSLRFYKSPAPITSN